MGDRAQLASESFMNNVKEKYPTFGANIGNCPILTFSSYGPLGLVPVKKISQTFRFAKAINSLHQYNGKIHPSHVHT